MGWGSKTQIITSQSVAGTEVFSSYVGMLAGALAHVQVKADFPGTPTDDLEIRLYGTLDASSEVSDTEPLMTTVIPKESDPGYRSIIVSGLYKWRIGVIRSGSTDTITVDAWYRVDGVEL